MYRRATLRQEKDPQTNGLEKVAVKVMAKAAQAVAAEREDLRKVPRQTESAETGVLRQATQPRTAQERINHMEDPEGPGQTGQADVGKPARRIGTKHRRATPEEPQPKGLAEAFGKARASQSGQRQQRAEILGRRRVETGPPTEQGSYGWGGRSRRDGQDR